MEQTTTSDGVPIAYEVTGEGPAVVFVHGITDSHRDWQPVIDRLSGDHRCIALDLRGHGDSGDASDYGALAMTQDVAAVVAAVSAERPAVIGHSLGGVVVTAYAASAPVKAVINVDQSLQFSRFAASLRPLESALRGTGFHEAVGQIFTSLDSPMLSEEQRTELANHRTNARQDVVIGVWDIVFTTSDDELDAVIDQVGPLITVPYLALHGIDPGDDYEEWLRERIHDAHLEVWADHGHYPHLVDPDRFAERVRSFVD
jgi:pimeloyl-ACP methyl ester carboxylesterase